MNTFTRTRIARLAAGLAATALFAFVLLGWEMIAVSIVLAGVAAALAPHERYGSKPGDGLRRVLFAVRTRLRPHQWRPNRRW